MFDGMLYKILAWCAKTEDKLVDKCLAYKEGCIGFVVGIVTAVVVKLIF